MPPKELLSILQDIGIEEKTETDILRVLWNVLLNDNCNSLITEYLDAISYDDVKYERLMQFLRLFRNPIIQDNKDHHDVVGAFVSSIKKSAPLQDTIYYFVKVLSDSIYIQKPIISLQRRSFTL
jgi:replication-associated recombination protein RarA